MGITRSQIVLFSCFVTLAPLSIDMYVPAMRLMSLGLQVPMSDTGQSFSVFFIGFALGQLVAGPLSDRIGRRPLALMGLIILLLASCLGALTSSFSVLLLVRIGQALGVCSVTVAARAAVHDMLAEREAARVFSLLILIGGFGPVVAPWLGLVLVDLTGWRSVFVLHALLASVLLVMTFIKMSESLTIKASSGENPAVSYWKLLRNPMMMLYVLAGAFNLAGLFTFLSAAPPVLTLVYGVEQGSFALVFAVNAVAVVVGSQLNRVLLNHWQPREILQGAVLGSALLGVLMCAVLLTQHSLLVLLAIQFFVSASIGPVQANALALALGVDDERAGSAAALFGAVGFAVGAILSATANALFDGSALGLVVTIAGCQFGVALFLYVAAYFRKGITSSVAH